MLCSFPGNLNKIDPPTLLRLGGMSRRRLVHFLEGVSRVKLERLSRGRLWISSGECLGGVSKDCHGGVSRGSVSGECLGGVSRGSFSGECLKFQNDFQTRISARFATTSFETNFKNKIQIGFPNKYKRNFNKWRRMIFAKLEPIKANRQRAQSFEFH